MDPASQTGFNQNKKDRTMKKSALKNTMVIRALFTLLTAFIMQTSVADARTLAVRSAVVAPGDTVTVPIEISADVLRVCGFQMDLTVTPSGGAPSLTISSISKGAAVTTSPDADSNPQPPTPGPVRIGLPTEIPVSGTLVPEFNGPGAILTVDFDIPADAAAGQSYRLDLSNVVLAGPDNPTSGLAVFGGTLTLGGATVLADTITAPSSITVNEAESETLTVTVTGGGTPVPGVDLSFIIDNPEKASLSSNTARTGADGQAAITVSGLEDGNTLIRIASPGIGEVAVNVTVLGVSPIITSSPVLFASEGNAYTYDVQATDPQAQNITFSLVDFPAGMTINSSTGVITWASPVRPSPSDKSVNVTVEARDPDDHFDTQTFAVFVIVDADNDGYDDRTDCDDANSAINPGQTEVPYNSIDDDCNLATPDDDLDGDGHLHAVDCDDNNPSVNPDATEILYNGLDDDCDPITLDYVDNDGDGYYTQQTADYTNPADCDDGNPYINPGVSEIRENGLDDDCNPETRDNLSETFVAVIDDGGIVYYARSNGDGTFSNYRTLLDIGGYNSRGVTIGDFNNDGHLDIMAGGGVSSRVDYFLLQNDGTDNFVNIGIVVSQAVSGSWAEDMASGDIDNDGLMDFVACADSGSVIIALNDGAGGFNTSVIDLGGQSRGTDLADFNRDGNLDIVRARYSDGYVYVYPGNGNGTFGAGVYVADVGSDPYGCVAADFNNDGLTDILANNGSSGDTYLLAGNGDFTFNSLGYIATLDPNNHVSYDGYDLNNDGNTDVVASDYSGRTMWFYPGNGDGTFGSRIQIGTTSGYTLSCSAPPWRLFGQPYAIIRPHTQTITLGAAAGLNGSDSNDNDNGGTIAAWNWKFDDGQSGSGETVSHTYANEGTYNPILTVTDNSGLKDIDAGTVVVQANPPVANHGGPYIFGESVADNGVYTVTLDGSGSTDDFGIESYRWAFDFLNDAFNGSTIDSTKWIASTGVTQNDRISVTGLGNWTTRYLFSQKNYYRNPGMTFYARILPVNTSGNQFGMFGFKNTNTNYSYDQMPYAIYFNNGNILIYEDGSNRGTFASYTRNQAYEIKIVLKSTGADYYMRKAGDSFWNIIYMSTYSTLAEMKVGMTINSGTFEMDDAVVSMTLNGVNPTLQLRQGTYPVDLTVTDASAQQDSASTSINVVANNPPVANPGGPYVAGEADAVAGEWLIQFNGTGSSDDFGILKYEWDFDAANGIQVEGTGATPIHFYNATGIYTVTLTVTDHALQTNTMTTTVTIDVSGTAPPVSDPDGPYTVNEEAANAGLWTVKFDGSGSRDDGGIAKYVWNFGDGGTLTTWYGKERQNYFEAGTRLYGYDVPGANLQIIGTQDNTKVRIVNLATGQITNSNTINRYTYWSNVAPGDGIYFKVEADKPVLAYETNPSSNSTFIPSLDNGPVGHEFIFYYYNSGYGFYVFAMEDTVLRAFNTSGTLMAEQTMAAGSYWNPGLGNGVYRFVSTGKISMQTVGINAYTTVPSAETGAAGRTFYCATYQYQTGALAVFAYDNADVTVRDMDTNDVIFTHTINQGEYWWQTGVGTRRIKIESTADVEVWAGDTEGGTGITNFGDDISVAAGRNGGREFYAHGLMDGLVVFAPYDGTVVNINGLDQSMDADDYRLLSGGALYHITSNNPVIVQTLGRANTFNDLGTYLGGVADVHHEYAAAGAYTLTLTVYDQGNQSNSNTTTVNVLDSDPPVASHGGPYAANEGDAQGGQWRVVLDAGASTDDYRIYKYEWDFDNTNGIQIQSTEVNPTWYYTAPGTYTVTLRVYDHAMQMTEVTTQVTIEANNPPNADSGGPYEAGEESAREGKYVITFDGTGSNDDYGIYSYKWDFGDVYQEDFTGGTIDTDKWLVSSSGVTQNDMITITGSGSWGQRYCFSKKDFRREGGNVFTARVRPPSGGTLMWGLKNNGTDYSYTQMPFAIYMNSNNWFYIYEDSANRASIVTYTPNQWYDLKIELKPAQGARYYYKLSSQTDWTLLYDSNYATRATLFKVGCTANGGTFNMDDIRVDAMGTGAGVTHTYDRPGNYPVSLTVTDHAMQSDTDNTTLTISAGDPPTAEAGGPYTGEPYSMVRFNGTGSTDDTVIARYVWDFGDGHTAEGAGASHFYKADGAYTATLTVYDNLLQSSTDTASVTITTGTVPIAEAGGPYLGGAGGPPVYFDGSGSSDDSGILNYTWDLTLVDENFSGGAINPTNWITGASGTGSAVYLDNEELVVKGRDSANWGSTYFAARYPVVRTSGMIFSGRIKTDGQAGYSMIGWKDNDANYSYTNMIYAIYLTTGNQIQIYEDGSNRGTFGTYANDTWYDLRIEIKATGASYYINDTLIYNSSYSSESNLRPCITAASRTQRTDDWRITGAKTYGRKPFFTYPVSGAYTATLTVEDGAGQTSTDTAVVQIADNLPPKVICVPWVATDLKFPHEIWNGKETTLKGIVKDANPVSYQWNFGDGTSSSVMSVTNTYNLSIKHTYPVVPANTPFIATLTVWDSNGESGSDNYNIVVKEKNIDVEINAGIDEGLWNLHNTMDRSGGANDGLWSGYGGYYASPTGSALQAFEINTHLESGDPEENPYVETVARGMRYLFTWIRSAAITNQTYGNPDTNGNGIGIEVASDRTPYEGGMVMMAIAASGTPLATAHAGGTNINGRLYFDILTDMADMYAYGQDEDSRTGGWRYNWQDWPDNSSCQWAALGLESAEETFNVTVPQWVKDRDLNWLSYSWDGTGWGYTGGGNGVATTPSGMAQLAFNHVPKTDWRWINAESYLASVWDSWYVNTRNYYALFALAKAFRIAVPDEVTIMAEGTPWAIDWYRDNERGVARTVLGDQLSDGSFAVDGQGTSYVSGSFRTAWGVVILSKTLFVKPPVADAGPDRVYGVDWELTLDGSGSYHTDPFRSIVRYEWDVDGDGVFDYTGATPTVKHTYHDLGTYTVTLRVTDDNIPPKYDTDTAIITIAVPPHPPIAVPGGPYVATAGVGETLNGSGSYDIDPSDSITRYGWELDGVYPYDFDDATGPNPVYTWNTTGTFNVGLRVWDNGVMNDTNGNGQVDEDERLTDTQWTTITVTMNLPPAANPGGPYTVNEGAPLTLNGTGSSDPNGDAITYAWDLDNDGEYDDATGPTPTFTWPDNGIYTIGLQVSDSQLTGTGSTTVTVNDLGPHAAFAWSPEPQVEGAAVNFTDASTSTPDTITGWSWDFGGAGTSSDQNPSFTFSDNGTYSVTLTITDEDGSTDSVSHSVTITDGGPTAQLAGDAALNEGQAGNYDAGGSTSSPDAIVSYEWDWNYDGSFDASGDTGPTHSHVWSDNGSYTVAVRVTDDDGSTNIATLTVTVNDLGPTAALTGDTSLVEGTAGNFNAEGSSSSPDSISLYEWDWNYDGTFDASGDTGSTQSHAWDEKGSYVVAVRVTDEDGSTSIATLDVTITDLGGPSAALTGDTPINEGATGSYDASGSTSLSGTITGYEWDWDYEGLFEASGDTGATQSHVWPDNGVYTVAVRVTDDEGRTDIATLVVMVTDLGPTAAFTWSPEPQAEGAQVTFTHASTSSPDTITGWSWDFGGLGTSNEQNPTFIFTDNGLYTVKLTVTDEDGSTASVSHDVTITDKAPVAELSGDNVLNEGQTGSYDAGASSSSPDSIAGYQWDWDYDGTFNSSGDTGQSQTHVWPDNGTYTVAVLVTDDDGSSDMATLVVTVNNVAPSVDAGPDATIDEGATFTGSGSFTDPGADTHTATVEYGDGSGVQPLVLNPDRTFALSHQYMDNGIYTVTVSIADDDSGLGTDTALVTVNNVNPTVSAGPDQTVTEGDTVNFSGGFTDPGTNDTHIISWDFGEGSPAVSGTLTPSHVYPTAGTYTVTLTVTDDDGGTGSDTLTVTVESGQVPPVQTIFNLVARAKLNKIQLTWSPVAGAQCYNIYRSTTSGGPYTLVAGCHVTTYCTYLDEGLTIGMTYYYVVRSVTNGVESLNSNQASARPTLR
ncbi:hypothetical protein PITCH_A1590006 [uncultured Desulfobacterium sp.]|uniref:Uncharacterized protein n=1 Tax=uncultured Desulfobacterium sp. TaxID=201089 RepID=A0A445MTR7_9BACT|nr:hypothetical protein PITCH_A1590006 [uncultured Desulfobacterium sp.]